MGNFSLPSMFDWHIAYFTWFDLDFGIHFFALVMPKYPARVGECPKSIFRDTDTVFFESIHAS